MWLKPEASFFKSFSGSEPLVPAGQPGGGAGLQNGAPEAVRGGS